MRTVLSRSLLLCSLLSALITGAVQAGGLPESPACQTALRALEAAEDALAAAAAASSTSVSDQQRQQGVAARLQPLRKRVADACLGGLTTSPPPSQHTWVVPTVPGPAGTAPPRVAMPATPAVTVPLPRFEPPVTVTHCSAAVCFTSDGSTLTRVGPSLVGPRGSCTLQGSFVRCP